MADGTVGNTNNDHHGDQEAEDIDRERERTRRARGVPQQPPPPPRQLLETGWQWLAYMDAKGKRRIDNRAMEE